MSNFFKFLSMFLIIILTFTFFIEIPKANARPANVSDCINESEDCSELEDEKKNGFKPLEQKDSKLKTDENLVDLEESNGSLILSIIKMIVALIIVLIMIYGLLKFLNKRNKNFQELNNLENIGGISLGQNKSVQMIRVGEKIYLIGVGENVEMLQEIDDPNLKDELLHFKEEINNKSTLMDQFINYRKNKKSTENPNFKDVFKMELDKIQLERKQILKEQTERLEEHE